MGRKTIDVTGRVFSRWTVLRRDGFKGAHAAFLCRCECGTEKRVPGYMLRLGQSKSCGCLAREILGNRARRHGMHKHPLYRVWMGMHDRCRRENHEAYPRYGGRGIEVCPRWLDFSAFHADMEPSWRKGLTLDRMDNDGDYSPENCRWATRRVQANNRRNTRFITLHGKTLPFAVWARRANIPPNTIYTRLSRGWSEERAFTTPPRKDLRYA